MRKTMLGPVLALLASYLSLSAVSFAAPAGPVKISFWHYLPTRAAYDALDAFAAEFNRSQTKYVVSATGQGDPKSEAIKIVAALRGNNVPTMALVDNAFFNRLAVGDQALALDKFTATIPAAVLKDFYPAVWQYGEVNGRRYGLPWAASALLLYYNVDALRSRGLSAPKTWDELAKTAKLVSSRASKGLIWILDMWPFATLVDGRGGQLFKNGLPNFNGPDALDGLKYLADLNKANALLPRSYNELSLAGIDFLRTRGQMVVGTTSVFPAAKEYSYAIKIGAVALPGKGVSGEGQIVILDKTDPEAQKGAWEFWQFLNRPENLARWVKASYYLPTRRSVTAALGDFVTNNVVLSQGLIALERSEGYPHAAELNEWELTLNTALERVLKGNDDPVKVMEDAQRAIRP